MLVNCEAYVCQGPFVVLVFPCYCLLWNWDESERMEGLPGRGGCVISTMYSQQNLTHQPPHPGNKLVPAASRSDLLS